MQSWRNCLCHILLACISYLEAVQCYAVVFAREVDRKKERECMCFYEIETLLQQGENIRSGRSYEREADEPPFEFTEQELLVRNNHYKQQLFYIPTKV